jgi:hypothetical protein
MASLSDLPAFPASNGVGGLSVKQHLTVQAAAGLLAQGVGLVYTGSGTNKVVSDIDEKLVARLACKVADGLTARFCLPGGG